MDSSPVNVAALRREYAAHGLRRSDLDADPIRQFDKWFGEAIAADTQDGNAMTLATVSGDGKPSARVILLKGFDERGFAFFTNYSSDKAQQMEANGNVSLSFFWRELERQIRIGGTVEKTSREESEIYFRSRPPGAQLGAWASRQSEVIDSRKILDARLAKFTERYANGEVPLPPHWGGYRVRPETIEFWQGRPNRLHDRFRYTRKGETEWIIERLAP